MHTYTSEIMPVKKQYAGNMDSTLTPKIYCGIKHTQHIIPDAIYIASVPGTEGCLVKSKLWRRQRSHYFIRVAVVLQLSTAAKLKAAGFSPLCTGTCL